MTNSLRDLQTLIGKTNGDNGFNKLDTYPEEFKPDYVAKKLLLSIGEISYEAFEEIRSGRDSNERWYGEDGKPEGFPAEIADAIIRLLGVCDELGLDMQEIIEEKMLYNSGRDYLHGRRF